MANKKKKGSSPIKTREQLMAEKRVAEAAARRRNITILMIVVAAILAVAMLFTTVSLVRRAKANRETPGFNPNGQIKDTVYVKMTVEGYGDIILKLDGEEAPITVANFVTLVNEGFYDGLTFHRVIEDFMIQGGDPNADGTGGAPNKIKGEFEENGYHNCIAHERGVISMARNGQSYDSASSQFFICNSNSDSVSALDGKYAAFGRVIYGMNVVDLITSKTAYQSSDMNGSIPKGVQAVISHVEVISAREARSYRK